MPSLVSVNNQPAVYLTTPTITWRSSALQQDGQATVFVHKTSGAYTSAHLGTIERKSIPINIQSPYGTFDGLASVGQWTRLGVTLECSHISKVLGALPTPIVDIADRTYEQVSGGTIMYDVFSKWTAQLGSDAVLTPGVFNMSPPFIDHVIEPTHTLRDLIATLYNLTGFEYTITDRKFSWVPPAASLYATTLIDTVHVMVNDRTVDSNDQVQQLRTNNEDETNQVTLSAIHATGIWARAIYRTSQQTTNLGQVMEAAAELEDISMPKDVYTVGLLNIGTLWRDIREGMAINIICPGFGFKDVDIIARILSRTYNEGSNIMPLEVQLLRKPEAVGLAGVGMEIPKIIRVDNTSAYNRIYEAQRYSYNQLQTTLRLPIIVPP